MARKHEAPIAQIARGFGISEATLHNWLKKADIEDGTRPGVSVAEAAELRDAKRRIRLQLHRRRIAGTGFSRG